MVLQPSSSPSRPPVRRPPRRGTASCTTPTPRQSLTSSAPCRSPHSEGSQSWPWWTPRELQWWHLLEGAGDVRWGRSGGVRHCRDLHRLRGHRLRSNGRLPPVAGGAASSPIHSERCLPRRPWYRGGPLHHDRARPVRVRAAPGRRQRRFRFFFLVCRSRLRLSLSASRSSCWPSARRVAHQPGLGHRRLAHRRRVARGNLGDLHRHPAATRPRACSIIFASFPKTWDRSMFFICDSWPSCLKPGMRPRSPGFWPMAPITCCII